ncbi:hypothetical protein FN846DRAFT_314809 [Sphaerosporella brunnea]|uniref:NACHT domain-containing protein n=1 Tax=Sphaerosporella brunnea TaxID=1250544 RepID=A0A5J5EJC2_9PEZI|nr:hypothetical protein FN846DRAFT_314809 [Sphaerosporella brunnea]
MDPFSIFLGGITICQVAQQVISLGIAYGQSATSLPAEVQALISEITLLSGIFDSLCSHLKAENGATRPISADLLDGVVEGCNQQLEELRQLLEKHQSGGSRLRKLGRALKWPMKEQETRAWIARMEGHKTTFSLALKQEELAHRKKMTADMHGMRLSQESQAAAERREKQKNTFRSALAWVSPADPYENHFAARKRQQEGTGRWLTESSTFGDWERSTSSSLWIYGGSGTGKTILSSIIIDRLLAKQENQDPSSKTETIFFYCDFRDSNKASAAGIYGSLIGQLLEAYWPNELPDHFELFYEKNKDRKPHEELLKEQLLRLLSKAGRTRILVDALDEFPPTSRIEVLQTLIKLQQTGKVNLLVTSREEVDIKTVLKDFPKLRINAAVNSEDIRLFVTEECDNNIRLKGKLKGSTRAEVIATISDKAGGMFRWAKCCLDDIARLRNDKAIKQALGRLPKDLNEIYERILARISEDDKELAIRILQWLSCSLRPLKVGEVIEGVALELGDAVIDPETFINPNDIIDICGSLVALDLDNDTVALEHFSVKEFLTAPARKTGVHSDYFINPQKINFELAKLCLTYLCLEHFSVGPCATGQELVARCDSYGLYHYAASKWAKHARGHVNVEDEPFISLVERFFVDSDMDGNFNSWRQVYRIPTYTGDLRAHMLESFKNYLRDDIYEDRAVLRFIYACRLGLYSTTKHLISLGFGVEAIHLQDSPDVKTKAKHRENALTSACASGEADVVDLVVSAGADLNAIAGMHGTALIAAINAGHGWDSAGPSGSIVKLLLEKGADVNQITPSKDWPLHTATGLHDFDCAKLCVDAGADLSLRKDGEGLTSFEHAAAFSHKEIFELLRQHGGGKYVEPEIAKFWNLTPGVDGYALLMAAQSNLFESAEKILEQDGEKIFNDPAFESLVHHTFKICAWHGYYKFIEQMLAYTGGNFSSYNECVALAASQGFAKSLSLLLDVKPPAFEDRVLQNLAVLASGRGHQSVLEELQKRGVSPLCVDDHGWTTTLAKAVSAALNLWGWR